MHDSAIIESIFLVFAGAAALATMALFARQAMISAYIVIGALLGPWGAGLVTDATWIGEVSDIGIMFLLYLLGLNMEPRRLMHMLGEALAVTAATSGAFALIGFCTALALGLTTLEAMMVGACLMFSSTIIGLKLLPTTTLHNKHTGEVIISILLLQDLAAIAVLLVIEGYAAGGDPVRGIALQLFSLPVLAASVWVLERYLIEPLITRYDQIQEYVFLLVIAWCLSMAQLAYALGLSYEIGAFVAGVALAACPAAPFIADSLRPLRDFFLVLFFFSLGASFDPGMLRQLWLPAAALALVVTVSKPTIFRLTLARAGEQPRLAQEIGWRLGQVSEFSLLIAVQAFGHGLISEECSYLIQFTALLSFIISSWWIVKRYPSPIAVSDRLRRD